jgi:type VI protein secretion system component VasF
MTGPFADLIGPPLEHLVAFQGALQAGEQPAMNTERAALVRLLNDADKRSAAHPVLAKDYALARHAVIYLIDEIFITAHWEHAAAWKNAILELQYFPPPRKAAEDFWTKADQAEAQARGGRGTDPLEAFYLCAALGFRGHLFLDQPELSRWFDRTYPLIHAALPVADEPPTGPGVWGLAPLSGGRLLVAVGALVAASAVWTALVFIASVHLSS